MQIQRVCLPLLREERTLGESLPQQTTEGDDQKKSDRKKPLQTHHVEVQAEETDRFVDKTTYKLFAVMGEPSTAPPLTVQVMANQAPLKMEVDTGASVSLISKKTFTKLWPDEQRRLELQHSASRLRTYTGQELEVQGSITVKVTYGSQQVTLPLLVVAGDGPSLLALALVAEAAIRLVLPSELQAILNQHKDVFKDKLGCVKESQPKLWLILRPSLGSENHGVYHSP